MALEPYIKPVTSGWRSLVECHHQVRNILVSGTLSLYCMSALPMLCISETRHRVPTQVQNGVQGFLEENRLPTPLAADKLAWFTVGSQVLVISSRWVLKLPVAPKLTSSSQYARRLPLCSRCRCSPFARFCQPRRGKVSLFPRHVSSEACSDCVSKKKKACALFRC